MERLNPEKFGMMSGSMDPMKNIAQGGEFWRRVVSSRHRPLWIRILLIVFGLVDIIGTTSLGYMMLTGDENHIWVLVGDGFIILINILFGLRLIQIGFKRGQG